MYEFQKKTMVSVLALASLGFLLSGTFPGQVQAQHVAWVDVTLDPPAPAPPAMHWPGMAFDEGAGVTVLFGGHREGSNPYYDRTWTWDGATWEDVTPSSGSSPSPRDTITMAYATTCEVHVIFGGSYYSSLYGDTWELGYDGSGWYWAQWVPSVSPPARSFHALASCGDYVLLFGGWDGSNRLSDTWEWDCSLKTWTEIPPPPDPADSPSPRQAHGMAYDSARDVVVLFGGVDGGIPLDDTGNGTVVHG